MKTILYTLIFLTSVSFSATAQSKIMQLKQKNNFMLQWRQNQNLKSSNEKIRLKINPYWQDVDAPHFYNSYMPQIKVPCYNAVWALIAFDTVDNGKTFLHTANNGKSWLFDTVDAPASYGLGSIAATDANTCYASMNDADALGGGIFKTTDGGKTWKQLGVGKILTTIRFRILFISLMRKMVLR